jgi:4-hydroxy-3-polyprenylbenzoate decarboxylase
MRTTTKRRIGLFITGASGAIYGLRVLEALLRDDTVEVHATLSPSAQKVLKVEHGIDVNLHKFNPEALGIANAKKINYHTYDDVAAPPASGSFRMEALAIVPCSMGCVGAIAHGISDDLIQRSADVMIKERRPLIVVPRETPLSAIHLENLLTLAKLGVTVLPASPGFYGKPKSVDDMVNFVVARVLDHLKIDHELGPRWGERPATP